VVAGLDDGSSITNVTTMWIHDGGNRRDRKDSVVWERSPAPDSFFAFRSTRTVTLDGFAYEVDSDSANMREARCTGSAADDDALFGGTAAVGSINRLLPRDARLFLSRADRFLGYEDVAVAGGTRRASVWGWYDHDSGPGRAEVGHHKVWVSVRTGWPMREEELMVTSSGDAAAQAQARRVRVGAGAAVPAQRSGDVTAWADFTFDFGPSAVSEGWYLGVNHVESAVRRSSLFSIFWVFLRCAVLFRSRVNLLDAAAMHCCPGTLASLQCASCPHCLRSPANHRRCSRSRTTARSRAAALLRRTREAPSAKRAGRGGPTPGRSPGRMARTSSGTSTEPSVEVRRHGLVRSIGLAHTQ